MKPTEAPKLGHTRELRSAQVKGLRSTSLTGSSANTGSVAHNNVQPLPRSKPSAVSIFSPYLPLLDGGAFGSVFGAVPRSLVVSGGNPNRF